MAYKVLIAEDDTFLVNAYQAKLTKEGFEIRIAYDGEEAMKILGSFVPDVILLDLVMPRKDGFATLEEIKASPTLKNIPVIVTSNLGQEHEIDKVKALGAADFITKSNLAINDLAPRIKAVIGK